MERPEEWLRYGCAWEVPRPEYIVPVQLYGRTEHVRDEHGKVKARWVDGRRVMGMPYDVPIAGYGPQGAVNTLRLWRARAAQELDLADFNAGDYLRAVEERDVSENISKVLYPNDVTVMGKELRLQQQYFFVACSIDDIVKRHLRAHPDFSNLPDKAAIQLNDTHPAIAIAELMRVLVDVHGLDWDQAWAICRATFGYTNHTLLPEALERWSVDLFGRVLPRHLEIIYELNARFLEECRASQPRRRGGHLPHEPDRGGAGQAGAHGQPGGGGLALGQRRGGAPHRPAQGPPLRRLRPPLAGQVQQQDQRGHAAPLAAGLQPRAGAGHHRGGRARLDHRRRPAEEAGAAGRGRRLPPRLPRHQARQQGAAGRRSSRPRTASPSTSTRSSTCR